MIPLTRMAVQEHADDCGIAALAMMLCLPMQRVRRGMEESGITHIGRGLSGKDLITIARACGRGVAAAARRYPTREVTAVVRVRWDDRPNRSHWVFLARGLVFETDGTVWDVESYITGKQARLCTAYVGWATAWVAERGAA